MPKIDFMNFENNILAIMPEKFNDIVANRKTIEIEGVDFEAATTRTATKFKDIKGSIVTVPLYGYISHKASIWSAMGLETSSETFAGWMDDLASNPQVGAIVIDIDSPGGTVSGVSSVTDKIHSLRGTKPIIAVVNDLMASAAYWIGSAADEIVADPESLTGSIGVFGMHADYSKALEEQGIKVTFISAGKFKVEGNPYEPLSDEAKAYEQSQVDDYYESFIDSVARNRGVSASKVKADFGQGRIFTAKRAKEAGLVDRVGSYEQVIDRLKSSKESKAHAQATCDLLKMQSD